MRIGGQHYSDSSPGILGVGERLKMERTFSHRRWLYWEQMFSREVPKQACARDLDWITDPIQTHSKSSSTLLAAQQYYLLVVQEPICGFLHPLVLSWESRCRVLTGHVGSRMGSQWGQDIYFPGSLKVQSLWTKTNNWSYSNLFKPKGLNRVTAKSIIYCTTSCGFHTLPNSLFNLI